MTQTERATTGPAIRASPPAARDLVGHRLRVDGRVAAVSAGVALAAGLLFWVVRATLIDDAYITLSYARNLAFHGHWGLIAEEPANSATSPLYVILLAVGTVVVRDAVWALGVVYVGSSVALAWWLTQTARTLQVPVAGAVLALALVLVNPFVLSATGLATILTAALLAGLLCYATQGRPGPFGLVAGLAMLTRLDLVIFIALVGLSSPAIRGRWGRAALAAGAVSGPWFFWSWLHFGSAVPDTFVIKTLQESFGRWTFVDGPLLYLGRQGAATVLAFTPALLGGVGLVIVATASLLGRRVLDPPLVPVAALGAGGIVYYGVYSLLGVPPYQWYYCPVMAALAICLAMLLAARVRSPATSAARKLAVIGQALPGAIALAQAVVVVEHDLPWRREPVIFGNWATPADYARVGTGMGERVGAATVTSPGEIGTLAYFCECAIVDSFSDRGRVVPLVEERMAEAGPVARLALKLNYWHLDHDLQPRPADYSLVWRQPGPAPDPDSWDVSSSATGAGHLRLIPADKTE